MDACCHHADRAPGANTWDEEDLLSDQAYSPLHEAYAIADLKDLAVGMYVGGDGKLEAILDLHVEVSDGKEFSKKRHWRLAVGPDDLRAMARQILADLE